MTGGLAVVVVNYGSHALLARNLTAIGAVVPAPAVIVVDNFTSTTNAYALAELAQHEGWHVVAIPTNIGFGAGVNRGLEAAYDRGCATALVLNPDVEFTPDVIAALHDAALDRPDAMITPTLLRPDGSVWFEGGWVSTTEARLVPHRMGPGPGRRPWLTGACIVAHTDLWKRLGGYDEDYFLYWEDVDLSVRCLAGGGELIVRPDLRVVHDAGGTQKSAAERAKSAVYYRYNCRNRLLFAAKHASRREQVRWIVGTPADAQRVVLRGGRRQLVHPGRSVWPAIAGCASGVAWLLRHRRP